jgi:hypothetical protein
MTSLFRLFKWANFEPSAPAVMPSTAKATPSTAKAIHGQRRDSPQHRHAQRPAAEAARCRFSCWLPDRLNQIPCLQDDQDAPELHGADGARGARAAERQAQFGSTFNEAHQAKNMRQPGRTGTSPASPELGSSAAID